MSSCSVCWCPSAHSVRMPTAGEHTPVFNKVHSVHAGCAVGGWPPLATWPQTLAVAASVRDPESVAGEAKSIFAHSSRGLLFCYRGRHVNLVSGSESSALHIRTTQLSRPRPLGSVLFPLWEARHQDHRASAGSRAALGLGSLRRLVLALTCGRCARIRAAIRRLASLGRAPSFPPYRHSEFQLECISSVESPALRCPILCRS